MKTTELRNRLTLLPAGPGHYTVIYTSPSGQVKRGTTNNMRAIDRVKSDLNDRDQGEYRMTYKQALEQLKSECK